MASQRDVLFLPNIWAIYECNHPGAPGFWGRSPNEVLKNAATWETGFVIVYQAHDGPLEPGWTQAGFTSLTELRWSRYDATWAGRQPFPGPTPTWFLLRAPAPPGDTP